MTLGIKRVNQYVLGKVLGKGASGKVHLVSDTEGVGGNKYAMKIVKRSKVHSEMAELQAFRMIHHPNIVGLHEIIDDPKDTNIYLVLDYISGVSLTDYIKRQSGKISQEFVHKITK